MPHYLMDSSRFIKELMNLFDVRGKIKKLLINKLEIDLGNIPRAKGGAISYFEVRQGKITLLRGLNNYELQLLGRLVFLPTEEGIMPGIYLDEYNYWDTTNGLHAIHGKIGATTLASDKMYGGIIATADTGMRIELDQACACMSVYNNADVKVGQLMYSPAARCAWFDIRDEGSPTDIYSYITSRGFFARDVPTPCPCGVAFIGTDAGTHSAQILLTEGAMPHHTWFRADKNNFYLRDVVSYYYFSIDITNKIFLIGDDTCISSDSAFEIVKADEVTKVRFATFSDSTGDSPRLYFHKSHNDTLQTKTETIHNDELGRIVFYGVDNLSGFATGAQIRAIQNGAAGAARVPTDLILYTYTAGAENTNQLVLYNDGKIGMGIAVPTVKLEVNGDIKCSSGLLSDMQGVIWTDSNIAPIAGGGAATTTYQANVAIAPGEIKVRTYFVKRPWMKVIRATAEIKAMVLGTAEMRINVGGVDGSIQSTANNIWTPKESTYNCAGLVNGTIYEILFYLRAIDAGPCSMRRPVIGWSVS